MRRIWAIADLHLSFGVPDKTMDLFGPEWKEHPAKISQHWKELIKPDDLVLLAGDLSWGMKVDDAMPDLNWVEALPGHKIITRGNHDYWWPSMGKLKKILPPSIQAIDVSSLVIDEIQIAATRLWDTHEFSFGAWTIFRPNPKARTEQASSSEDHLAQQEKIFTRELQRLELALSSLPPKGDSLRIAMTHYPPVGPGLAPSRASAILEAHQVDLCIFGHLHSLDKPKVQFGPARGVTYILTSCDYLDFCPLLIR